MLRVSGWPEIPPFSISVIRPNTVDMQLGLDKQRQETVCYWKFANLQFFKAVYYEEQNMSLWNVWRWFSPNCKLRSTFSEHSVLLSMSTFSTTSLPFLLMLCLLDQRCGAVPFWPGSSSSSYPVVHNLLLKKKFLKIKLLNLPGFVLFTERYRYLMFCFALPVLYLKGQINLILQLLKILFISFL